MDTLTKFAEDIFSSVGRASPSLPSKPLTGFLPMRGSLYTGELMVVGRAVNGWDTSIEASELSSPEKVREYIAEVWASVSSPTSDMSWVTDRWGKGDGGYNTRRSAFWRVIRSCVKELSIADVESDSWPQHLTWSNLYKISPSSGNPGARLRRVQEKSCVVLLQAEIAHFKPKRLLFLTGGWEDPFLSTSCVTRDATAGTFKHSDGFLTRYVVAPHPMGKKESPIVENVVSLFNQ